VTQVTYNLIKYRQADETNYSWFWVDENGFQLSPTFDTEDIARSYEKMLPGNRKQGFGLHHRHPPASEE
jgi:hypothetical protein